jgi:uncharacterized protein YbaR (Trm112 family)
MTSLADALLAVLGDPETHEKLALANAAELEQLRAAVRTGTARRRDGKAVSADFEGALLTPRRNVAYLVQAGIPNLLLDERLELESAI